MCNEISAILSHLNEITLTAAILRKEEAKTDVTGSLLDVKRSGRPHIRADVNARMEELFLRFCR